MAPNPIEFQNINSSLKDVELDISASYTHGVITAFMSTGLNMQGKLWLEPLIDGAKKKGLKNLKKLLLELYEGTFKALVEAWDEFELVLPEGEIALNERAKAVSEWCEGYLYGLALAGIQDSHLKTFSEEDQEMVERFVEISQLDFKSITISEDDEHAYQDLCDYIKSVVLEFFANHTGFYFRKHESEYDGLLH